MSNFVPRLRLRSGIGKIDNYQDAIIGGVYGYFAGGNTGAVVATADRITFSTGTTASFTAANVSQARQALSAISDKANYGYFLGGSTGANILQTTADRITFSTGTTAAFTAANLPVQKFFSASLSDGFSYGYYAGGFTSTVSLSATADRITFSTGTTAAFTAANLSSARSAPGSVSDGINYGYFAGGDASPDTTTTDRITFSTGTTAAFTAANLSVARRGASGLSDAVAYGYFVGGFNGSSNLATADRITFSTSTTAAFSSANLSQARRAHIGSSDGNLYGYYTGGITTTAVATADRLTFSTGTTAAFTAANLSQARYSLAGLADYAI